MYSEIDEVIDSYKKQSLDEYKAVISEYSFFKLIQEFDVIGNIQYHALPNDEKFFADRIDTIKTVITEKSQLLLKNKWLYLECACCDQETKGRQWPNRDDGYGVCSSCFEDEVKRSGEKYALCCYGVKGVHHSLNFNKQEQSSCNQT